MSVKVRLPAPITVWKLTSNYKQLIIENIIRSQVMIINILNTFGYFLKKISKPFYLKDVSKFDTWVYNDKFNKKNNLSYLMGF